MKKAVFIIPFFGKLPSYFQLWMKTASKNEFIDYWIFTDDSTCQSIYSNVIITHLSFCEFRSKVQKKFDFQIALDSPRKLCDFKPAYGYILEEDIVQYPYWGYCDVDVILGDLNRMIPWDKNFQKLFVHGHMTLFLNTREMNRLFMSEVKGFDTYKQVFSTPINKVFDEASDGININLLAREKGISTYFDYRIADINPYHYLFHRTLYDYSLPYKKNRIVEIEKIGKQLFLWDNGHLFRLYMNEHDLCQEEIRYLHFQKRLLHLFPAVHECNRFVIVPNRVIPFQKKVTTSTLHMLVKNNIIYLQYYRLKWNNLKKRIKAIV